MTKTNVVRLLQQRKIPFQVLKYSPDLHSAQDVALVMQAPISHVYKTIVVLREKGKPMLVMVQGDQEVNLRLLAKSVGEKKLRLATHREAEDLTGLQTGGISALALLHHGFDIYADRSLAALDYVHVSAGQRGMNIRLAPADLIRLTGAELIQATEEKGGS